MEGWGWEIELEIEIGLIKLIFSVFVFDEKKGFTELIKILRIEKKVFLKRQIIKIHHWKKLISN